MLLFLTVIVFLQSCQALPSMSSSAVDNSNGSLNYRIVTTWDGDHPADGAEIRISFRKPEGGNGMVIDVDAPLYNEPVVPDHFPVGSTDKLWNYEVVEVFFLSESDEKYLEIELAPRGHYLLLLLDTGRNVLKYELPLQNYTTNWSEALEGRWKGSAVIPLEYFPKNVNKFNAYAIHKSDPNRVYMSLFPTPKGKYDTPNFHRLECFGGIDLSSVLNV